ncbi:MAG: thiamine pyrophosphate-binding protein [Deltaproteobacteria bacterium]|nr:MAG: thiamine pyrophosphate-binding protein [Deltaproteobacteria bacterium]
MRNNSEMVVDALERTGIRYLFGYPGGQNARFIEALHGSRVELVLVTHEACAGFMADVYGRLTGRPGACLSTLGPGATNMTTGVGNAYLDRVPLLAFTAQMGRSWKGRTVQMHIDHQRLYAPITKWSAELETGKLHATLKRAVEIALAERPGPVHLDFPEDVADEFSEEGASDFAPSSPSQAPFDSHHFDKAVELIRKAKYPLVAIGLTMNRAKATAELRAFLEKHRLPVVTTLMAKGHVAEQGSSLVGVLGRARREVVAEYYRPADLVIAIGYDPVEFNYEDWVRKDLPILHIDTVPADIAAGYSVPCQVIGDIREALRRLADIPKLDHHWDLEALGEHRKKLYRSLTPEQKEFAPHHALLAMREILPEDGLLVSDVGAHTHLIGQLWAGRDPGNFLVSNGWSSMGFAIPAAISAKLVQPERPVVACMGDGGFLMMVGEINTAVRLRLPVVFVVLRDNFLSLIRVKQDRKKFHPHGVEMFDRRYQPSDNFFGARVVVARNEDSFRQALRAGLQGDEPLVIEAVVNPSEYNEII